MLNWFTWYCCKLDSVTWFFIHIFSGLEAGEMMTLEDEISHLQKENSRIESQLSRWLWYWSLVLVWPYKMVLVASKTLVKYEHLRMKGDVSSTEGDVVADDRVRKITITRFRFVSFVFLSSLPLFLLCFFVLLNRWIMILIQPSTINQHLFSFCIP